MMVSIGLESLRYGADGLIPVVIQDAASGRVLTLAYANEEAVRRTAESGETWLWSRSRSELWRKGATSGNTQKVEAILADCDGDALVYQVRPAGPACHTGAESCFHRAAVTAHRAPISERSHRPRAAAYWDVREARGPRTAAEGSGERTRPRAPGRAGAAGLKPESGRGEQLPAGQPALPVGELLARLRDLAEDRKRNRPEGSYTTYLFDQGLDKICKKIGEEATEVVIALKNGEAAAIGDECADLLYHLVVGLAAADVGLEAVGAALAKRLGKPGRVPGGQERPWD